MAIPHAHPAEVVSVRPLGERLTQEVSTTLVKTDRLEALRLVLPRGKSIRRHEVSGEITLQCLEGRVEVDLEGRVIEMNAGEWMYLDGSCRHGLRAILDSTVLVTILLTRKTKASPYPWPSVLIEELSELEEMEA